jgi:activator of HSP90 ATPase
MPKNVILAASLPATADRLFDMYLAPQTHAAFTGAPVVIASRPGASFSAFDGMLTGTILHVEPKRLIVQTWRSANWPAESIDSVLTLSFWPEGNGARIELVHVNVPEADFAGVSQGWEKYYWQPWRDYLGR